MTRAGQTVSPKIVKMLLHVGGELLDARRDAERFDVGGGVAHDVAMVRPDRAHHILFEKRDGVLESKESVMKGRLRDEADEMARD